MESPNPPACLFKEQATKLVTALNDDDHVLSIDGAAAEAAPARVETLGSGVVARQAPS